MLNKSNGEKPQGTDSWESDTGNSPFIPSGILNGPSGQDLPAGLRSQGRVTVGMERHWGLVSPQ